MKKGYLVFLFFGIILLGGGVFSLTHMESIAQDRYLISWICNILIAIGATMLYLSIALFRHSHAADLADARAAAAEAEKRADAAKIEQLERELTDALNEIRRLKTK